MDSILMYRDSVRTTRTLPPNIFLERAFEPLAGPAVVTIRALAKLEDQTFVNDPRTKVRFATQNVRLQVAVFAADGAQVVSRIVAVPIVGKPGLPIEFLVSDEMEGQQLRVEVRNVGDKEISCTASVEFVDGRVLLHATPIPLRVLNHALRQLLFGLAMEIHLDGSGGRISLSPDLAVVLGRAPSPILFNLPVDIARDINLKTFTAAARTTGGVSDEFPGPFIRLFVEFETVGDVEVEFGDIDLANLDEATLEVDVRLSTEPGARGRGMIVPSFSVRANIGLDKTIVGSVVSALKDAWPSGQSFDDSIEAARRSAQETLRAKVAPLLSPYLTEGFLQLASRTDTFHDLILDSNSFAVRHFDPNFRPKPGKAAEDVPPVVDLAGPADPSAHHVLGRDPALDKLNNIRTFVVLMQENRSFDNMLGYLSLLGGRADIDGLSGNESNTAPGDLTNGINQLQDTKFELSPSHEIGPVTAQVADGDMTGFLASFVERYPFASLGEDNPLRESPLSFYGADQLPAFDFLVRQYLVCDRWFCSLPGATQPNRFCTLSGATPTLNNFAVDDPRVGYITDKTIFDLLPRDVDWVYYEHDVGSLRFYDRYRLDDRHVIPFDDPDDGFHVRSASGTLPQVVFIDPDFVDVPFGKVANDDHPPADVADGQRLITSIYNRLVRSPQWPNLLFVITYDEHGGFFDHVPPPGTRRAIDEATASGAPARAIAAVHPDGPTSLGVRVPTVVVSPWVPAGQVSSVVFDHTSIGKSILLRFLGRDAPMLSRRMRGIPHLGELVAAEARTDRPLIPRTTPAPRLPPEREIPPGGHVPLDIGEGAEKDEFHEIIRRFGQPIRRRRAAVVRPPTADRGDQVQPERR